MKKSTNAANGDFKMVVLGCSAGGIEALSLLLSGLPAGFKPTLSIVQHIKSGPMSNLARHFSSRTGLPTCEVEDKELIVGGTIFFAPPDYHLLVGEDGRYHLSVDPHVRFARPSIDVLFESAAVLYGKQVLAIVLTGSNDDGAAGARKVVQAGGRVLVQDPDEAQFRIMPAAALAACPQAEGMRLADIGVVLGGLT